MLKLSKNYSTKEQFKNKGIDFKGGGFWIVNL